MRVLQRFENRLEDIVGGAFARLFRGRVEPVEIAKALQREADSRRAILGEGRVMVPNRYVVELGQTDFDRLSPWDVQLTRTLAEMVQEFVDEEGWSTYGDIEVHFELDESLRTGVFRVASNVDPDAPPRQRPHDSLTMPRIREETPPPRPQPQVPQVPAPALLIDATNERFPLNGGTLLIGRGQDADLRFTDSGVSRRHAVVRYDGRVATIEDLHSTNGTLVNGQRVETWRLLHGDVIRVGHSVVVYTEQEPAR